MSASRTSKSIKNSTVAMVYYLVNLGLQFVSRKIFLDYLGTEILGLNTTATNLLQFLNLAELGISAGVSFTLYKPIAQGDRQAICEIVSLQGCLYRRIAAVVIGGAAVVMLFFPLIFDKITLPLWYAYASFAVLLLSALLGYFVNYRQVVLTASQQDYRVVYSYKSVMLLKVCAQMLAVRYLAHGYEWWLVLEAVFAVAASASLSRMTRGAFPFLERSPLTFRELRAKYADFTTKIKQLLFHKIGGFALSQSSPLIIYAYTTLTVVALYGNYLIVTAGVISLVGAIFNSIMAGVGNLVADGDKARIREVFDELFSIRFLICAALCFTTFYATPSFIELWIGREYLLPTSTLALMTAIMYIQINRYTIDSFINAYGLFGDIYAPLCEATLNIGLSILLGIWWGLDGVLTGVLVSLVTIIALWKPYYLFTRRMPGLGRHYIAMYAKHLVLVAVSWLATTALMQHLLAASPSSLPGLLLHAALSAALFTAILSLLLYALNPHFRHFSSRLLGQFVRK